MPMTPKREAQCGFGVIKAVALLALLTLGFPGLIQAAESAAPEWDASWQPSISDPGTDIFAADADLDLDVAGLVGQLNLPDVAAHNPGEVTVDYPLDGTAFPPEFCPPTFLWHDNDPRVKTWLIAVSFENHPRKVYALTAGTRSYREIDPRCVTDSNEWIEPPYQASAKAWTPDERTWSILKQRSTEGKAIVTVHGVVGGLGQALGDGHPDTPTIVSRGSVTIITSKDPVDGQIFYRDVPLMPSLTDEGRIKPLVPEAMPLIQWRLRDVAKPSARIVMRDQPTCANCHTFSMDGKTLAMDMDGPNGDKGAYAIKDVSKHMAIEQKDIVSWNSFQRGPTEQNSLGLFAKISPDGRYAVATVEEDKHILNYMDWRFLQTFYPTRGILAVMDRNTRGIQPLPGADDHRYVQSNAVWSPDGQELIFIRATARPPYTEGVRAKYANDPNETQIQYDLYRVPFNEGRGGTPEPVAGASDNGMSNSFPQYSPDGKWIVYVQAKNGLLMRPDSKLYIVPAQGGEARLMACNTPRMNSWHSFSPNGRWMVFSSKWPSPFTQMYLTHIDESGRDTPAVLIPNSTAANRAVNLPEFAAIPPDGLVEITTPAAEYRRHLVRAGDFLKENRYDKAIEELEKSLALRDDFARTYGNYGVILTRQGKIKESIEYFQKAIECDPEYAPAYASLGFALTQLGRPDEGVRYLAESLKLNRDDENANLLMAITLRELGRSNDAAKLYRKVLALNPDNAAARDQLATFLATDRDPAVRNGAKALRHAEILCRNTNNTNPSFLLTLAAAQAELGQFDEAHKTAEKARQIASQAGVNELAQMAETFIGRFREKQPIRLPLEQHDNHERTIEAR